MKWHEDPVLLQQTRERLGLTRLKLAGIVGVKRTLIVDLEEGRSPLSFDIAGPLWEALTSVEIKRRQMGSLATNMGNLSDLTRKEQG